MSYVCTFFLNFEWNLQICHKLVGKLKGIIRIKRLRWKQVKVVCFVSFDHFPDFIDVISQSFGQEIPMPRLDEQHPKNTYNIRCILPCRAEVMTFVHEFSNWTWVIWTSLIKFSLQLKKVQLMQFLKKKLLGYV